MDFTFTDEQNHLRKSVREFAEGEIAPHVMEWDECSHFPLELLPKLAEMGLLGVIFPEEYGGAGLGYIEYATVIEELSRVDGSIGLTVAAHNSLCTNHIYKFANEEQKRKYLVPARSGPEAGRMVAHRAGSWLRRRRHSHHRRARWQALGAERREDLHHQRPFRRHLRGHGGDRQIQRFPRHQRVHPGKGHVRIQARQKGKQAWHARQRHLRSDFLGLPRARRKSSRPGRRRLHQQLENSGWRTHFDCRSGARHGAGRAGSRYELRQATQAIRPGYQRVSGHPVQTCRHGHADGSRALAGLPGRVACRSKGRAFHARVQHGQAFRQRGRGPRAPTNACRSTAATASSRTIPRKSIIAT